MALRLSGLRIGRPDKAFAPPSGNGAELRLMRFAYQAYGSCRPDKAFTPHPATAPNCA
ncbi:hypothetical protein MXL54_01580 [Enterobacteriaceae bacterium G50]|nr:hypothetical protein [Enterobacteriaceae bacterium G50]